MEFGKLIPQVFFDLLARSVPGTVVLGSWIVLLGQDQWSRLLNGLLGGYLDSDNVVPTATLAFFFLSFLVGHLLAPFAKLVQRFIEWPVENDLGAARKLKTRTPFWVEEDEGTGGKYDGLRAHHPEAGALCAKIRGEFLMYDALSVAFLTVAVMALVAGAPLLAIGSLIASPVMVYRGAETQKTFQKTVGRFHTAYVQRLPPHWLSGS